MIGRVLGIGRAAKEVGEAVGGVAEVFVGNRAERDAAESERFDRALAQFGEEFGKSNDGVFNGFVDGLNRIPRPAMAIGTLGLFGYAMIDPHGFATRMQGLAYVPEPLWWLLGAVVSFYFGARELHHYRGRKLELPPPPPRAEPPAAPANDPVRPPRRSPEATAPTLSNRPVARLAGVPPETKQSPGPSAVADPDFNAAFEEWRATTA